MEVVQTVGRQCTETEVVHRTEEVVVRPIEEVERTVSAWHPVAAAHVVVSESQCPLGRQVPSHVGAHHEGTHVGVHPVLAYLIVERKVEEELAHGVVHVGAERLHKVRAAAVFAAHALVREEEADLESLPGGAEVIPQRLHVLVELPFRGRRVVVVDVVHHVGRLVEACYGLQLVAFVAPPQTQGIVGTASGSPVVSAKESLIVEGQFLASHLSKEALAERHLGPSLVQGDVAGKILVGRILPVSGVLGGDFQTDVLALPPEGKAHTVVGKEVGRRNLLARTAKARAKLAEGTDLCIDSEVAVVGSRGRLLSIASHRQGCQNRDYDFFH